jgi:hypothetical protein
MGKFRIKIKSSWFSEDYVELRYSTNGIFWQSVKCYEETCEACYMSTMTVHFRNAKELLSRFNSIEDVKRFEEDDRARVMKRNSEIEKSNRMHKEERANVYKQFS